MADLIKMYDEDRKERVNNFTIEDILDTTIDGEYSGLLINDGMIVGAVLYDVEATV